MARFFILMLLAICCQQGAFAAPMQTEKTIRQQMEVIKKKHSVKFVYDASLKLDVRYSGTPLHGLTLKQSLKELFGTIGVAWEIKDKYVLLTRARQKSKTEYTLSGYVYRNDGETLINATIWDVTTRTGTLSNEHGFFSMTLPEGAHAIRFSSIGCGERTEDVLLRRDTVLTIHLKEGYQLEEVVVTADLNSPLMTTQTGKVSLTSRDLHTGYAFMSSPDVVKTLQNLPGVAAGTELISGMVVHMDLADMELEVDDEPLLYNKNGLNSVFDLSNNFYQNLYIWSDEQIKGKEYTLRLKTYHSADNISMWDDNVYKYSYKVYLYKLSREFFLYLKSLNDVRNNDLGHKGLAPVRSHYSNVDKGIGVVGGCRITETEWMKNLSDESKEKPFMKWHSDDVALEAAGDSLVLKARIPKGGGTYRIRNLSEDWLLIYRFDGANNHILSQEVQNKWFRAIVNEGLVQVAVQPNDTGKDRIVSMAVMSGYNNYRNVSFVFEQSGE
ncbi:DUF4249 domain-containing protein [uncultured Bacteroides sp.]|uniref:DUF4249 domain-containing protein n=1 Tax=uncultured Bacteroides sp. TaxID=162156 RepID=UPI0025CF0B77|nr:DUF4249 domain-containing protein [uncultured Bacteroides sp.]